MLRGGSPGWGKGVAVIVRISRGEFDQADGAMVEEALRSSEVPLVPAIRAMAGLINYYAALDLEAGTVVNVSVWDSPEHAQAMGSLAAMQAQRPVMEAAGMRFAPIVNTEVAWSI